jgi:putative tricarboxylic transport membrane protein
LASFPNAPTIKEQGIDISLIPQARGTIAPPAAPKDVVEYWVDLFGRLHKTASWKKYLEANQLEDGFLMGTELNVFFEDLTKQMRAILQEAGAKVVR